MVGERNHLDNYGGKKSLCRTFIGKEFWKCIECIVSEVTYGKKGHKLWWETQISVGRKSQKQFLQDFGGKKNLNRLRCNICHPNYCYGFHLNILSYTTLFICFILL